MHAFDLDTAARYGKGPARFLGCILSMAVRDEADRLTLGPAPTPGVVGVEMSYSVAGVRYLLVPPPMSWLPGLVDLLRQLASGGDEMLHLRLGGHEFAARVRIGPPESANQVTIEVPVSPRLSAAAGAVFHDRADENGLILFEKTEFE